MARDARSRSVQALRHRAETVRARAQLIQSLLSLEFLDAEEAAIVAGVSPSTIRRAARRGELMALRVGEKLWRIRPDALRAWVSSAAA